MREYGGFEGNAQTLRILSIVEKKLITMTDGSICAPYGLNLTYRSLASVLKYDSEIEPVRSEAKDPKKGYYSSEKELVAKIKNHVAPKYDGRDFKTIECSVMDIADDIAYSTYDLEDSLHAGFITPLYLFSSVTPDEDEPTYLRDSIFEEINKILDKEKYEKLKEPEEISLITAQIFGLTKFEVEKENNPQAYSALTLLLAHKFNSQFTVKPLEKVKFTANRVGDLIEAIELVPNEEYPQLSRVRLKRDALISVELLKRLNFKLTIQSPRLAVTEYKGQEYVNQIFNSIVQSDGRLLQDYWKTEYDLAKKEGISKARRVVCDYVACMTDRYAAEFHGRLFSEGASVFKPL